MEKLRKLWYDVVESLWFIPGVMTALAAVLAVTLVNMNDRILGDASPSDIWWIFGGGADGAKSVLESISGSIITVTGVVFSVTIIALQLASSQFTPRVLRQFMADRANQLVLGVFIGTFTYTLLVQRAVRAESAGEEFVPAIAVTGALLLALTSIGFLIFFINHVARSIQAGVVLDSVARQTLEVLDTVYPDPLDPEEPAPEPGDDLEAWGEPYRVTAGVAGYLQAVDRKQLLRLADRDDLHITLEVEIGRFVLPGQHVMTVRPAAHVSAKLDERLHRLLVRGMERTPHQDLNHGIIELMDIAVKALSPSVNDPTTAVNAVHRLAEVLLDMAWRDCRHAALRDDRGRVRVVVARPSLGHSVALAFRQIRHFGAGNPTFMVALMEVLAELAALSPGRSRTPFVEELDACLREALARTEDPGDRLRLEREGARARARAMDPPPERKPQSAEGG